MSIADIQNILDTSLLVLFFAIIVILLLSFVRGLFRGWRYGTYRLIAFAILVLVAFLTLKPLANAIGTMDLSRSGIPSIQISLQNQNGDAFSASASFGTLNGVISSLFEQILKGYNVNLNPAAVVAYSLALAQSVVMLLLITIEGLFLATIGQLLVLLLWHVAFKHIIKKDKRKETYKKGRLISAFEELVVCLVVLAMFLFPLTSMVNSFALNWSSGESDENETQLKATNSTYSDISDVVGAYSNSLFAKAFFTWTKNSNGESYDVALMNFLATGENGTATVSFVNEVATATKSFSNAVKGGLLGKDGVTSASMAIFASSIYAPKLLATLGQSSLVRGLTPFAIDIALNIDSVAKYLKTDSGIDLTADYGATFSELSKLYDSVISSGILSNVVNSDGSLVKDTSILSKCLSSQYSSTIDGVIKGLFGDKLVLFDRIIEAAAYVQACHEYTDDANHPTLAENNLQIKDFLPVFSHYDENADGVPDKVPASISAIDWSGEILLAYHAMEKLVTADPDFFSFILNLALNTNSTSSSETTKQLITLSVKNLATIKTVVAGESDSLLDSALVENALPKTFHILGSALNSSLSLSGSDGIDLDAVATKFAKKDTEVGLSNQISRYKAEMNSLFNVVQDFSSSTDGVTFLENLDTLPGFYFSPDKRFLGAKTGLLDALETALSHMDSSAVASEVLPKALNHFLTGDSSPFSSLGLNIKLDFNQAKLGAALSRIVSVFSSCQDLIAYFSTLGSLTGPRDVDIALQKMTSFVDPADKNKRQLAEFLSLVASSPVFNPTITNTDGSKTYNSNLYEVLNALSSKSFGALPAATKAIIESSSFDASTELSAMVEFLSRLGEDDAVSSFNELSSSSTKSLSALQAINFEYVLEPANSSELLSSLLGSLLDEKMADTGILADNISFENVSDWSKEGASINALVKAALDIGDLSAIDFMDSDPDAVTGILKALAGSEIFTKSDGTYLFPSYFANKLCSSLKNNSSVGTFFVDENESLDSVSPFDDLTADILKLNTVEKWCGGTNADEGEAEKIGDVVREKSILNGFDSFSKDQDLSTVNSLSLASLLRAVANSEAFGRVLTAHLFMEVNSLLSSLNEDAFSLTNLDYLWSDSTSVSSRVSEADNLGEMLQPILDPTVGLLDSSGHLDTHFSLESASPSFLIEPVLTCLSKSQVFNSKKSGESLSAFEYEMASLLSTSGYYSSLSEAEYVVEGVTEWPGEISTLCSVLDDVKELGITLGSSFDFTTIFTTNSALARTKVEMLVRDINSSALLYQGLPKKIESMMGSAQTALSSTGLSFSNANYYYEGTNSTYSDLAIAPFGEDECETIASILYDAYRLQSCSLTNLASVPAQDATNLLANMAQSHIFNSLKSGASETVFDSTMGTLFGGDAFGKVYYSPTNPKDKSNAVNYSSSSTKASYSAKMAFSPLSASEDGRLVNVSSLNGSSSSSLYHIISSLQNNATLLSSIEGASLSSLSSPQITTALSLLNSGDLTYDIVPNLIASSIKSISLGSGVNLNRANPYYVYHYINGVYSESANYSLRYSEDEIEAIGSTIADVSANGSLFSSFTSTTLDITKITDIKKVLLDLSSSYVFEKAGASYDLESATSALTDDLSVFEQTMDMLYNGSKLSDIAYDSVVDSSYANAQEKLHSLIASYSNDKWDQEIANLTINDAADGGFLYYAVTDGIIGSGVNFSPSSVNLSSLSPDVVNDFLTSLNNLDLASSATGYEVQSLVGDTFGLRQYALITASFDVASSNFTLPSANTCPVYEVSVSSTGASSPILAYRKAGETVEASETSSGTTYTFDLSGDHPSAFEIAAGDGVLSNLNVTFATDNYLLGQSGYQNGGLAALRSLMSALWSNSSYSDLSNASSLTTFLGSAPSSTSLLTYLSDSTGFYQNGFSENYRQVSSGPVFHSRDVTLRNMLRLSSSNETVDLGQYLGNEETELSNYEGAEAIFSASSYSSNVEGSWLSGNLTSLLTIEGIYSLSGELMTIDGKNVTVPAIHQQMIALSSQDSVLTSLVTAASGGTSQLGERLVSGQLDSLFEKQLAYVNSGSYFKDLCKVLPASNGISRGTYLSSDFALSSFYDNNFALLSSSSLSSFLDCILSIESLMNVATIVYPNGSNYAVLTASDEAIVESDLTKLDGTISNEPSFKNLAGICYLGTLYDNFLNRSFFHGVDATLYPSESNTDVPSPFMDSFTYSSLSSYLHSA